jgi:hypothetical protein
VWYHLSVTVPAGTTEANPVRQDLKVTHGVITYLGIGFPGGCKQLVKARIYHAEHQIFPANPDEPAAWNNGIEGGEEHYRIVNEPFNLVVRAYAPLSTVAHTISVFILLLPVEVAEPWTEQKSVLDKLKGIFGLK